MCTEDDYYNLPENIRAELIDGQFYDMAAPSRLHMETDPYGEIIDDSYEVLYEIPIELKDS